MADTSTKSDSSPPLSFGGRLRQLREEQGLGVRELARLSGLSLSHLYYLENDEKTPGDRTLAKLAVHLGVSTRQLIADRDAMQIESKYTLLMKEIENGGPLSKEQRQRFREIADEILGEDEDDD